MELQDNTIGSLHQYALSKLSGFKGEREIQQIVQILFAHHFGLDRASLVLEKQKRISESEILKIHFSLKKILSGEPIQHITGESWFHGFLFKVNRHVLIPRPETEELVQLIIDRNRINDPVIFDIGTGSGCIAIALKKKISGSSLYACDISIDALYVAKENADRLNAEIQWINCDILHDMPQIEPLDIVVSNPPYIHSNEMTGMDSGVVNFEPHQALFVPGGDVLLFYRKIIEFASAQLREGGMLAFEIHENMGQNMLDLFHGTPFQNVELVADMQQKSRFVLAWYHP